MKKLHLIIITTLLAFQFAGATVVNVAPGDDLRRKIMGAKATDTVFVQGGTYTMESALAQTKDIVLIGDPNDRPVVNFTNFILGTEADKLVVQGLKIVYQRKYLIYCAGDKTIDIDQIIIRDCIIDMNKMGASMILDRASGEPNRIGDILIDDCIVYNGHEGSHGVMNIGADGTATVKSLTIKNSTMADFMRGLVIVSRPVNGLKINISDCTFYNINTSENTAGIVRANDGDIDVTVANSIFNFKGEKSRFVHTEGDITVTNSYRTNELSRVVNEHGLLKASGNASQVFMNPGDDPTAPGISFKIIDTNLSGKNIGDPRWN